MIADSEDYINLRALGLADFTLIFQQHMQLLESLYTEIEKAKKETEIDEMSGVISDESVFDMAGILHQLLAKAPDAVATAIALASEEPDQVEQALKLPSITQLECLAAIGELTFSSEEDLKNVVAALMRGSEVFRGLLGAAEPSDSGSLASANK